MVLVPGETTSRQRANFERLMRSPVRSFGRPSKSHLNRLSKDELDAAAAVR